MHPAVMLLSGAIGRLAASSAMSQRLQDVEGWAQEEFGHAMLGDARRGARLVAMAERLGGRAHGTVTTAFTVDAERQAAYRFLENTAVLQESLADAAGVACARRGAGSSFFFVPIDKTSATLSDPLGLKGFGAIGNTNKQARGFHAVSAIGVGPEGDTLGMLAQQMWMRRPPLPLLLRRRSKHERARQLAMRQRSCRIRPTSQKETQHWIDVIEASARRCDDQVSQPRCWFQLDREGDAGAILSALAASGHFWTVRSAWDRRIRLASGGTSHLRLEIERQAHVGYQSIDVPAGPGRRARRALLLIHVIEEVELDLRDAHSSQHTLLRARAVWAHEVVCPRGEAPLDWLLLTNQDVVTLEQAQQVLNGYATRWRIEEVHRTWKHGGCFVEATQLHSEAAIKKWATLLFSVATRVERLKRLARTSPEKPATTLLSAHEIRALLLLKRRQKKRTEVVPDTMPSLGQAARWMADLGGYTGKSSGGPPGSVTIGRGFAIVVIAADVLEALEAEGTTKM